MIPKKHSNIFSCILFLSLCEVYCDEKSSLTFVIDDTISMETVIDQVKFGVNKIFDTVMNLKHSQIEDFILITFNDPDPFLIDPIPDLYPMKLRTITKDKDQFKDELTKIRAHGGGWCPEYSMTGIMEGIVRSRPRSIIYVFTDASAKDYKKYEEVKNLAINKQSQVIFILTGYCSSKTSADYLVYQWLADATSGIVFDVNDYDIHIIINDIISNIQGRRTELIRKKFPSGSGYAFHFKIDDMNKEPTITVTGNNPSSTIFGPDGEIVRTYIMVSTKNVLITKIINSTQGYYTASVGSTTDTRVVITARTEVMFQHGFSTFIASSINATTIRPLPDIKSHIHIKVTSGKISLQKIKIIDNESGRELKEIALTLLNENENFYVTEPVELPKTLFKLSIIGYDPATSESIIRTGSPIQPQLSKRRVLEVTVIEGAKVDVDYNGGVRLTCEVFAYPEPNIVWTTDSGVVRSTKSSEVERNKYISYLKLSNVKKSGSYYCKASNSVRRNIVSKVDVNPRLQVISAPSSTTSSKYGARTDITCDVKSLFPLKIRWFFKSKASAVSEIYSSDKYTVSPSGTTLHILFTDLDMVGKYTCEASLLNDGNQKVDFTTNVQIDNLSPPVLQNTEPKIITVKNKDKVTIPCKLLGGVPPPVVSWQIMRKDDNTFRDLFASGPELTLDSAALVDAGQYRCIAKNAQGQTNKTTELIVQQAPAVSIDEGASVTVPYGSTNEFKCRIVAFPLPEIVSFQDNKGNDLIVQIIIKSNYEVTSQLRVQNIKASDKYSCYAENTLGNSVNSIQVTVLPAIHFGRKHPETTSVKYKDQTNIICDAKSSFPLRIKWFYQKNKLSKKSEIHTSDKYIISFDERMLHITSTDLDLVGKYTCEVSLVNDENEKESFTTKVEINNLKAPEITESDKTIIVMNGQEMSAVCKADGITKPDVTWEFKSTASEAFTTIPAKGERITNPKIGYEGAGSYKCTATSEAGTQSRIIDVVVHGEPKITNIDSTYYGVTGDKVLKIPCNVTGVPEPTITWKHDDKVVTSDSKILVAKNALFIKNPTERDSSNFTCEAKNKYGNAKKKFEATVSDFLIDNDEDFNSDIYLKPGDYVKIGCLLPHSDPQSIRWYVNDVKMDVLGSFYLLENVDFSNDGNYTCRLNTEHGSESRNYVVDVGYEPSFAAPPTSTIIWKGDNKDLLDCTVRAKPREEYEWFYNGKQLDGKMSEFYISGWGSYTCNVSNVHGSVQHTFNVTSDECIINRTANRILNTPLLIGNEPSTWPRFESKYDEFLPIRQNEIITLECSTQDQPTNTFKTHSKANRINAECYNEDKFIVDGKLYKFEDLQCKEYVRSSLKLTKNSCMQSGQIIEVGFKLNNSFLGVYEVCYSEADHKTLYTKVIMSDVNIGNIVGPSFVLNEGIKTSKRSGEITKCQYNKRWLVSPVDVAFGPAQIATLSDKYNAVSVHEPCEGSSRLTWSGVEIAVESMMYGINTLPAWTGASHYNSHGIPRYLWKVVKFDDDTFEAIVYVNAPSPSSSDILCPNTTPQKFTDITDANDKYTYSCSIEDFMNTFKVPMSEFGTDF